MRRERRALARRARRQSRHYRPKLCLVGKAVPARRVRVEEARAKAAWANYASGHPRPCPLEWAERVYRFVETLPAAEQEPTTAVLLIALQAHGEGGLFDSWWIRAATTECHLYFDGPGFGPARVLLVVEKFLRWTAAWFGLGAWRSARLLHHVDDARESHGLRRRNASALDTYFDARDLDALALWFTEEVGSQLHPISREMAASGIRLLHAWAHERRGYAEESPATFGSIDLEDAMAEVLAWQSVDSADACSPRRGPPSGAPSVAHTFLEIATHFYAWLASKGYLETSRAQEIARCFAEPSHAVAVLG